MDWIQDFLTTRTQKVVVNGHASSTCNVTSGVPQGSVLEPTLILLYINDWPGTVTCNTSLYADYTLLYQGVNTKQDQLDFQANIDVVYEWSQNWEMPFNVTKCHAMAFNSRAVLPSYRLGATNVVWARYLGVTLQQNLKFDKHISEKVDKGSRILGAIKHTIRTAPEKVNCWPILASVDR